MDTRGAKGAIVSSAYQNFAHISVIKCFRGSPKKPKKPMDVTYFKFENKSNTARSSNRSLYLVKSLSSKYPERNCGGNQL